MSAAMAMFAVQRGIQTQTAMVDAFTQQAQAQLQSDNIQRQMDEIETRTKIQTQNIFQQAEKIQANQAAAYISGGVELTGSAMSVLNDTLNEAAQAAYIRQRESDYELIGLSMQQAAYDQMASNHALFMNLTSAALTGSAGFASDAYRYNRASTAYRGASGLGGSDTSGDAVSYNYQPGAAQGIS